MKPQEAYRPQCNQWGGGGVPHPPRRAWDQRLGRDLGPGTGVPLRKGHWGAPPKGHGTKAGKGPGTRDWGTPQVWTDRLTQIITFHHPLDAGCNKTASH